jgi:hypothetical protein
MLLPCTEDNATGGHSLIATPTLGLLWLNNSNGNLLDCIAAYVADANEVMKQEGSHGDEQGVGMS